jgi:hypothetical protein
MKMGLDMYLQARRYVYNGTHIKDPEAAILSDVADKLGFPKERESGYSLTVDIGYWRKANAIHQWFVDHSADGVDDCRPVYLSRESLEDLRGICQRVLDASQLVDGIITNGYRLEANGGQVPITEPGKRIADPSVAAELLPTANGFFFGSTEYTEWYLDDIRETVEILDRALALDPAHFDILYRASW